MSSSEWKSIDTCPEHLLLYLVDHEGENKPYIGCLQDLGFYFKVGQSWHACIPPPTHWAPIPMLKPPLVKSVRGYAVSAGAQDGHILSLYSASTCAIRLMSITSPDRAYLTAIGEWAVSESLPWTQVAEAIRNSSVESE